MTGEGSIGFNRRTILKSLGFGAVGAKEGETWGTRPAPRDQSGQLTFDFVTTGEFFSLNNSGRGQFVRNRTFTDTPGRTVDVIFGLELAVETTLPLCQQVCIVESSADTLPGQPDESRVIIASNSTCGTVQTGLGGELIGFERFDASGWGPEPPNERNGYTAYVSVTLLSKGNVTCAIDAASFAVIAETGRSDTDTETDAPSPKSAHVAADRLPSELDTDALMERDDGV